MSLNNEEKAGSLYCLEEGKPVGIWCSRYRPQTVSAGVLTASLCITSIRRHVPWIVLILIWLLARSQNRSSIISVPEDMGFPDGMTVDAEGMLWVAIGAEAELPVGTRRQLNCCSRSKCQQIRLHPVVSVAQISKIYILLRHGSGLRKRLQETPQAGALFVAKPGVKGRKHMSMDEKLKLSELSIKYSIKGAVRTASFYLPKDYKFFEKRSLHRGKNVFYRMLC